MYFVENTEIIQTGLMAISISHETEAHVRFAEFKR